MESGKSFPVFKKGKKEDLDNYRPISILCTLSKIIERHVHKHLYAFLSRYRLLHPSQSGFRKYYSCETSLTHLLNNWINALDKGNVVGCITIDIRKAFDVFNFEILLIYILT